MLKGVKMTLTANAIDHAGIISETNKHISHEKHYIRLTLVVSILAGPILFLVLNAASANFAQTEKSLALLALTAITFETTWIIYGFTAMIHKAINENR